VLGVDPCSVPVLFLKFFLGQTKYFHDHTQKKKTFKGILHKKEEHKCNHKIWKRIKSSRQVEKQMRISKESNTKKNKKMSGTTTYLSIITLNVHGLSSLVKNTDWQIGLKTRPKHLLPIRSAPHWQRQTQA
jgi:hypothetical protein